MSRLKRLRELVTADLEALPDKPVHLDPDPLSDDEEAGGVSLDPGGGPPSKPSPNLTGKASADLFKADTEDISSNLERLSVKPSDQPDPNTERRFVWLQGVESSWNRGSTALPVLAPIQKPWTSEKLPAIALQKGYLAPAHQGWTPILALSKYPYKFVNGNLSQSIATKFFDAGKFWAREWDLYYVWTWEGDKPLILVSELQFQDLLDKINRATRAGLRITEDQREDGLVTSFPDHPRFTPRYLGRSTSRKDYDSMAANPPHFSFRAPGERTAPPPDDRSLEAFKRMMEDGFDLTKNKSRAQKAKKKQERILKQQAMGKQFKRAQRYLGLRPTSQHISNPQYIVPAVDPSLHVPFPFDSDVVFISVDVEAYEKNHRQITEVGIATIDTRDLVGVPPGIDGLGWKSKIRCRHFRIREHSHLRNGEYVDDAATKFEFGTSEWLSLKDAHKTIGECFKPPFCAVPQPNEPPEAYDSYIASIDLGEKRNLILLGHETSQDISYLQQLGYNPLNLSNLLEYLDTALLYRVWKCEPNPTRLGNILYDFNIIGWNLHNAGNDAFYTSQALLAICVRESTIRGDTDAQAARLEERANRIKRVTQEALERAKEDMEGWSGNENDDGGAPVLQIVNAPMITPNLRTHPMTLTTSDHHSPNRGAGRGRGRDDSPKGSVSDRDSGRGRGRGRGGGWSQRGGSHITSGPGDVYSGMNPRARGRGRGRGALPRGTGRDSEGGWSEQLPPLVDSKVSRDLIDL